MAATNGAGGNSLQHFVTELKEIEQNRRASAKAARVLLAEAKSLTAHRPAWPTAT